VEVPGTKAGEADGDYHFNILADTPTYSNSENCKQTPPGKNCQELIAEIICYDHSAITLQSANNACQNYQNKIYGPKVGQTVTVTGKWVKDDGVPGDRHYWNEIHPVTGIK
jgi:hypothetical protein